MSKSETEDAGLSCGTELKEGDGLMVVVAVGMHSQVGIIMNALMEEKTE